MTVEENGVRLTIGGRVLLGNLGMVALVCPRCSGLFAICGGWTTWWNSP